MSMQTTQTRETPISPNATWSYLDLMFGKGIASDYMPALGNHNGKLACMFVDKASGDLKYAFGTNSGWDSPTAFNGGGVSALISPALADDGSVLHTVFTEVIDDKHDLVHYQYNDTTKTWGNRAGLAQHSSKAPTLAVYNGKLFCAFAADDGSNHLLYCIWTESTGWSAQKRCNNEESQGTPALCLIGAELHLLFAAHNDERDILELVYDEAQDSWSRSAVQPTERAEYGVSATSTSDHSVAFLGFLSRAENGHVLASKFANGSWGHNEEVDALSYNTPALAILGNTVSCAYTARNGSRELLWSQRSALV